MEHFKAEGFDMTIEQFVLLKMLHEEDGQKQNNLAIITDRDKTSLTRLISTLEKKNLVKRIPSTEDRRVNKIFLTANGRTTFENATSILTKNMKKIHRGISKKDQATVIAVLQKIQQNISIEEC